MRVVLTLIFFLFLIISLSAQKKKNKLPVPPNSASINDSLSIDQTEICNIHWLEYLMYLSRDSGRVFYDKALPDTLSWSEIDTTGSQASHYLRYPAYRYFPVVGVTFEQAIEFCKWRSKAVTDMWNKDNPKSIPLEFTYRLPTNQEWMAAAQGKLDLEKHPYGYEKYLDKPRLSNDVNLYFDQLNGDSLSLELFKKKINNYRKTSKEPIFNILKKSFLGVFSSKKMTEYAYSLPSNSTNCYHMIGNVSEMIAEKGLSKGGSWAHKLGESQIVKNQKYTKPEPWLGFRCVVEVHIKK